MVSGVTSRSLDFDGMFGTDKDCGRVASEVGFIEPKGEPIRKGQAASPQQLTKGTMQQRVRPNVERKSVKVPPVEPAEVPPPVVFPSATPRPQRPRLPALETVRMKGNSQVAVLSAPASPVHRRTQSMSMVVGSPSSADTTHSNVRCIRFRLSERDANQAAVRSRTLGVFMCHLYRYADFIFLL